MKKQDNNKIFKLFVSSILVFSIFLTNISNIVVYGADAYSTEQNENTQNRKSDSSNLGRNVDTIQSNFNDIIDGLHSLLNDEQIEVFNTITANDDEVTELLKKAMILHENAEFEQAVELYDQVSAYLSEEMDDTSEATVQLVEAFSQLAETKVLLLEHEYIESTPTETEEPSEGKEINEIAESAEDNKHSESELDELTKEENTNGNNSNNKTAEEYIIPEAEEDESTKETATDQSEIQATSTMRASVAEPITSEKEVMYDAVLTRSIDGINTKPYGTEGYELIRLVDDLVGHQVRVTREAETPRSTWAYIEVDETDISGWIDKAGIDPVETVLSEKAINYEGKLARPTDGINTKPFGVAGSQLIRLVDDWEGRRVRATREAVTRRSTWAYVNVVGTDVSGWIDKAGLDIDSTTAEREVLYDAVLTRSTDGINTKPYGTEGYELIRLVDDLVGHQVRVTREAETPRSTWAYIEVDETDISGWIDKAGIDPVETVLSEKAINYEGKLARPTDGINTKPFGVAGSELIRLVDDWEGRRVRVTREAVTRRSTWAYVNVIGTDVSGWIDKAGLEVETVLASKEVTYNANLKRSTDGINTKPYGTEGYELIRTVGDWEGKEVRVIREAVTQRSTWAYVEVIGAGIAGWVDKTGLDIENYVVYLDPGHGGSDSGASYNGVHEKNLNLSVSMKTKDLLENKGYTVVMSRTNDSTVGLYDRPAEANSIGADILVSVHHNAMPGNTNVTGIETYYYKSSSNYPPLNENLPYHDDTERLNDSLNLAQLIQDELINHTNTNDRGVKSAAFVVVRETHMPAVLLELGYMSSPSELNKLQQTGYQYAMANAVADAIDNYFRK